MRDGISLARRQVPVVTLVMTEFLPQGDFVARASGMPGIPRVEIPAVAGTEDAHMVDVAEALAPLLLQALQECAQASA